MSKIVIHVGYGKTGTTAIQGWLLANRDSLAEMGVFDCGPPMDNPAFGDEEKHKVPALVKKINKDPAGTATEIAERIRSKAEVFNTVIWSSEFLLNKREFVSDLVSRIGEEHDVEIVLYLRNHVDWLQSAYSQWAIKHPVSSPMGGVVSFDNFVAQRIQDLDYVGTLKFWSGIEGAALNPRSYDECDDIVIDFADILGVDVDSLGAPKRPNENLGRSQLALLKIIQENTGKHISYQRFGRMLRDANADGSRVSVVDPTPLPVSNEKLKAIHDGFAVQRKVLEKEFGVVLKDSFKMNRVGEAEGSNENNTDLISMLGMVCMDLFERVAQLESQVKTLNRKK